MDLAQLVPVVFFSTFAYWQKDAKQRAALFIMACATALFTGFAFYDSYVTPYGLAIGLMFLCYAIYCFIMSLKYIFWNEE